MAAAEPSILLAIKPLHYQGQQLLKARWTSFITKLRTILQQSGFEAGDSSEALLLFTFNHPYAAITALSLFISKTRHDLESENSGPLPLQIIVHLRSADEINPPYRNPGAGLWELLTPEAIHITRPLKAAWEQLMAQKPLPPSTFSAEGDGLFKLTFTSGGGKTETLISCRAILAQGPEKPCFYCGLQNHKPSQCPSKYLTMDHEGLEAVGYLPFEQLNLVYQKVFSRPEAMAKMLAVGINPSQIRKSPELMVFVGFFDINRVYQPRFLWNLTFSRYSKWQSLFKPEALQIDNKNLQLGLDCLRVGKYGQAEEFLVRECHAKSTRRFSAAIGLAFLALEQKGLADMRTPLVLAKSMTTQPKERLYIDLLLSRFYDLIGEIWKARDTVRNILIGQADCTDALYRKLQLEVKGNFSAEACQLLRSLLIDQRTTYMAALMDPALLPIETMVEDLLSTQYGTVASSAQDFLAQADNEIAELALWLESSNQQLQDFNTILDSLKQCFEHKSYFEMIEVEYKAKALLENSRQVREGKLNELFDQIKKAKATWDTSCHFWVGYRYQMLFKAYGKLLLPVEKALQEAGDLAKRNEGATYHKAIGLLRSAEQSLTTLHAMHDRMNLIGLICDSTVSFLKKLTIIEIAGFILASALGFALGQLPAGHELKALASDPLFQKKATTLTAFMIAPLLTLSWTIVDELRRR